MAAKDLGGKNTNFYFMSNVLLPSAAILLTVLPWMFVVSAGLSPQEVKLMTILHGMPFFIVIVISSRFTKPYQCHPSPPSKNFLKDSVFFFLSRRKKYPAEDKWSILREKCSNLQKRLDNLKKKLDSGDAQQHWFTNDQLL